MATSGLLSTLGLLCKVLLTRQTRTTYNVLSNSLKSYIKGSSIIETLRHHSRFTTMAIC